MKNPYIFLPLAGICLIGYFLTLMMVRTKVLSHATHRKIWNSLLLITFLVTGILGILLVINLNYRLEWTWIKTALRWHVHFGIGMVIVAIFHLSWHLNYYLQIFTGSRNRRKTRNEQIKQHLVYQRISDHEIRAYSFLLGYLTLQVQLVFLRQFLNLFSGNELIIGCVLFVWMLITGLGATAGKKFAGLTKHDPLSSAFALLSILPLVLYPASYFFKVLIFPSGTLPGLTASLLLIACILFPFCFLSGIAFTQIIKNLSEQSKIKASQVYIWETLGALLAGLLYTFLLSHFLNTLFILALPGILILWLCAQTSSPVKFRIYRAAWVVQVFVSLILVVYGLRAETRMAQWLYPGQKILLFHETPYGRFVLTEQSGQKSIINNGSLLATGNNTIECEESVHYPLVQINRWDTVLIISGDLQGMLPELEKYPVRHIDYADINPFWVSVLHDSLDTDQPFTIGFHAIDPLQMLRKTPKRFNAILIQSAGMGTLQENRLFSAEFIGKLKKHLQPGGVSCWSLPTSFNYLNPESRQINSSVFNTLKKYFAHVQLIPGEKLYLIASDSVLNYNIPERIEKLNIKNDYVNQYYIDSTLLLSRINEMKNTLISDIQQNLAFRPSGTFLHIRFWLSQYRFSYYSIVLFFLLTGVLAFIFYQSGNSIMLVAGGAGSALEFLVILGAQILYGSAYQTTGLLIALYMAGMAVGAWAGSRIRTGRIRMTIFSAVIVFLFLCLITPLVLTFLHRSEIADIPGYLLLSALMLVSATIPGLLFALIAGRMTGDAAGTLYAADLTGSAVVLILTTVFIFPVYGLYATGLVLGGVILAGYLRSGFLGNLHHKLR